MKEEQRGVLPFFFKSTSFYVLIILFSYSFLFFLIEIEFKIYITYFVQLHPYNIRTVYHIYTSIKYVDVYTFFKSTLFFHLLDLTLYCNNYRPNHLLHHLQKKSIFFHLQRNHLR